jgi:hypothetical protein
MHPSQRSIVVCAALCACLSLLAAAAIPALAGKNYKTTLVSLSLVRGDKGVEAVEGRISSPKAACLGHRLARASQGGGRALGTTYTDGSGKFSYKFNVENAPPNYKLPVRLVVYGKSLGRGAVCEAITVNQNIR